MIILTETQQQALSEDKTNPPIVLNPATNEKFVLIPAVEYDEIRRPLLAEENAATHSGDGAAPRRGHGAGPD